MAYSIRSLDTKANPLDFDCGEQTLNEYLQRYASQDIKRGVARAFVATPQELPDRIAGFYTLSASSIAAEIIPEKLRKKLPRYPVPVALLGRLAVDKSFHGRGLGSILLVDACKRVNTASASLGVAAIVVDAKSAKAAAFYQHFGFVELAGTSDRWLLPRSHFVDWI